MAAAVVGLVSTACGAASGSGPTVGGGRFGAGAPADLVEVHGAATRVYDQAAAGREDGLPSDLERLQAAWQRYSRGPTSAAAPPDEVRQLQQAVTALNWAALERDTDRVGLVRAANRVAVAATLLADTYDPVLPFEVREIERFGRELVADGLAQDCAAAGRNIGAIEIPWRTLRPKLLRYGSSGADAVQAYESALGSARSAAATCAPRRLVDEGRRSLELLDRIRLIMAG
jgi:hypothetical protein